MTATKVPMTPSGQEKLRAELKHLREVEKPRVTVEIGTAREHGDLSENAEYHAAKERQGMIMARIGYLEDVLSRAEVIDPSKLSGDRVQFGARVTVMNLDTEEESSFQIVGQEESDAGAQRISIASPLARALVGKEVGDEVTVKLPAGKRVYEIVDIAFG